VLNQADIIVAHNASFDRAFMDRYLPLSQDKVWVCSVSDINWPERGFGARGQEILCIWHGFYYESHRAMSDVDALIHLVTHEAEESDNAALELIANAAKPTYKIAALNSPFETKDILKSRRYRWDPQNRYWWKNLVLDEIDTEKEWMADNIYNGHFQGRVDEIGLTDKHKS
jgi:DNA polymerase-3 subunit epsilon